MIEGGWALWPSRFAIALPAIAAIVQFLGRNRGGIWQLWFSVAISELVGGLSLLHFYSARQYACILEPAADNCFVSGLGSLMLPVLLTGLAILLIRQSGLSQRADRINHTRLLLVVAGLAGLLIGENLLIAILSLLVLFANIDYWLSHRGLRWGFLVVRDDYRDDIGPDT